VPYVRLVGGNFLGSKVTWPELKCISIYAECALSTYGGSTSTPRTFYVSGPKFIEFLLNFLGIAVDQVCFQFSISRPVPEIFVVKIKSCPKACQILDVFCPPKYYGGSPPRSCT